MAGGKVFYDQTGNTLTVWFGDPQDGKVIGFEKLSFSAASAQPLRVAFETVTA